MANPIALQAIAVFPKGAGAGTDNVTSLGTGVAKGFGGINQSAAERYDNKVAPIRIKTNATAPAATGYATLYIVTSEDGTVWTDGIDPDAVTTQKAKIVTATLVQAIAVTAASTTYYFQEFSIASVLGFNPGYWSLVLDFEGGTTSALSATATDHYTKYIEAQYA